MSNDVGSRTHVYPRRKVVPLLNFLAAALVSAGCTGNHIGGALVPQTVASHDAAIGSSDLSNTRGVSPDIGGWGLVEYPLPWKQGLTYIASDGNGNEWTGASGPPRLVAINEASGLYVDFALPGSNTAPYAIALGRNHNGMWLTEPDSDVIGYIRFSDHVFKLFSLSGSQRVPKGITSGPDNAMWFAEFRAKKIARISMTDFKITEYSVSPYRPEEITLGTDGALWFTTENLAIGRITTSGHHTIYQLDLNYASAIATGPDGAIWFTGISHDRRSFVGRIDLVTHKRTYYKYSSNGNGEGNRDIASRGSDLWMTNTSGTEIDRFDVATHRLAKGRLPAAYFDPFGIALGTDNQLWFTNKDSKTLNTLAVGKLCPDLSHQACAHSK